MKISKSITGWSRKKLRFWLVIFFIALAVPTSVLIYEAWSQLKWEAFHRHRLMAEELSGRIDRGFMKLIDSEEARPFTDYAFLNVVGDPAANYLQRSPLSNYPVNSDIPGLLGYFQVDAQGRFSSPLLPPVPEQSLSYGITESELADRRALQGSIMDILSRNHLVEIQQPEDKEQAIRVDEGKADDDRRSGMERILAREMAADVPEEVVITGARLEKDTVSAQSAFDDLKKTETPARTQKSIGRVEDLQLGSSFGEEAAAPSPGLVYSREAPETRLRNKRVEQSVLPEQLVDLSEPAASPVVDQNELRISIFESEIDAFEISMLESGHFVLFRKVWRDGQRYIQGALIEPEQVISSIIESTFRDSAISRMSDLTVAWGGNVLSVLNGRSGGEYLSSAEDLTGELLFRSHLSAPLGGLELIFSVNNLPAGPGGTVVVWTAVIILIIMSGGFYLMYRLGLGQISLARQQQDFVSAVSHELKTPLTSIRMYGEMLREGWAEEDRKKSYYDYIYDESERLSRLINNVLQLARMTRNDLHLELKQYSMRELMDGIQSRLSSQIEKAGFKLNLVCDEGAGDTAVEVDRDCFIQIMINLVDNAIKFSGKAEVRDIDIKCQRHRNNTVLVSVRDYGPGISSNHMKKIFRLFYRPENELTRETVGTGIGLALVNQLALAMNGRVDIVNCEPGAEFRISLPICSAAE